MNDIEKELLDIIKHHESKFVEFKEGFSYRKITRVMCSFFTTTGGIIFIGIDDDGNILGLEHLPIKKRDDLLKKLSDKIRKNIGIKIINRYKACYRTLKSHIVLCIEVEPYNKEPLFHQKKEFVVRIDNQTCKLEKKEIYDYFLEHYGVEGSKWQIEHYILKLLGYESILSRIIKKRSMVYHPLLGIIFSFFVLWEFFLFFNITIAPLIFPSLFLFVSIFTTNFTHDLNLLYEKMKNQGEKSKKDIKLDIFRNIPHVKKLRKASFLSLISSIALSLGGLSYMLLTDLYNVFPFIGINIVALVCYIAYRKMNKFHYIVESDIGIFGRKKNK